MSSVSINREIRFIVGIYNNMKNYSKISVFLLIICVFGADGVRVSVMEGDSVTLDNDFPEKHRIIKIEWMFGDDVIAVMFENGKQISYPSHTERFRDRLKMNHQTGSLTINNMRITDSGVYRVQIDLNSGTSYKIFSVIVSEPVLSPVLSPAAVAGIVVVLLVFSAAAAAAAVFYYRRRICDPNRLLAVTHEEKTESAKESVALKTDTEKQTDDEKLKLDHQTGSLKITNTKTTDSRDSDLQIKPCSEDEVNTIFVEEGNHVTLNPDTEIQRDDVILWMFGDQGYLIAQMTGGSRETFDGPDRRFKGRLKLDKKTGFLTIKNIKSKHTGCYKLQIASSSSGTKYKIFKVITHGSRGKNANETLEIQLLSEKDPDRARVQYIKACP